MVIQTPRALNYLQELIRFNKDKFEQHRANNPPQLLKLDEIAEESLSWHAVDVCIHCIADPFYQTNGNKLLPKWSRHRYAGISHPVKYLRISCKSIIELELHYSPALPLALHRIAQARVSYYHFRLQMALLFEILLRKGFSSHEDNGKRA